MGDWDNAEHHRAIIVGSGPAGGTAALYLARDGLKPVVFHGSTPGGQLTSTSELENFPGWHGTGPDLVESIEAQATNAGADFRFEVVEECDLSSDIKKIKTDMGNYYTCNVLVVATGAQVMYLGLPNEDRLKSHGVGGCATCDGPLFQGKNVVVVGGGDVACEEALFLSHICKQVTLIHRRNTFRASLVMQKRVFQSDIRILWDTEVIDVLGENMVSGVRLRNTKDGSEKNMVCDALFVAIGHIPATEVFKKYITTDKSGFFVADNSPETQIPGVFVAGDCADPRVRQAITSAASGSRAAILARRYLCSIGLL